MFCLIVQTVCKGYQQTKKVVASKRMRELLYTANKDFFIAYLHMGWEFIEVDILVASYDFLVVDVQLMIGVHRYQHRAYVCLKEKWKHTVKPVLSGHSKIDKTKVFKTDGSLMLHCRSKVLQNALLEHSAILKW